MKRAGKSFRYFRLGLGLGSLRPKAIATCWLGGGFDSLIRNVWAGGKSDLTVVDDWVRTKNGLTMDGVALNHYSIPNFGKIGERVRFKRQSIFRSFTVQMPTYLTSTIIGWILGSFITSLAKSRPEVLDKKLRVEPPKSSF